MGVVNRAPPFPRNDQTRDHDHCDQRKKRNIPEEERDLLAEEVPCFGWQRGIEKLRPRQILIGKIRPVAIESVDQPRRKDPVVEDRRADRGSVNENDAEVTALTGYSARLRDYPTHEH